MNKMRLKIIKKKTFSQNFCEVKIYRNLQLQ